ncbi:MAG: amidase [Gammaproteobacteria bacterium]|nr:amidase [Gammaproteobacteria bacterium]
MDSKHSPGFLSIVDLRAKLASGAISASQLVDACIEREQANGPLLNAYQFRNDEQFRQQADAADRAWRNGAGQALTGIPVSLKSVFAARGFECYAGTKFPMPPKWQREGTLVNRLHQQLSPVSGLTHASELAFGGLGINQHWGTPRNPWDADNHRVPGGSSSGAALSVISGSAAFALGTDTGGSVRVPAAAAGLVGLKPGQKRWPTDGLVPLSPKFDSIGVIARRVTDVIEVFLALDGSETKPADFSAAVSLADFRVRLADQSAIAGLAPDLLAVYDSAIRELCKAGATVRDSDNRLFGETIELLNQGPNTAAIECASFIELEIPDWRDKLSPRTDRLISEAEKVTASHYLTRLQRLRDMQTLAGEWMQGTDIMISPTLSITTPILDQVDNSEAYSGASAGMLRNTVVANICGFCALTLPSGLDAQGMPTGLQLMAKGGDELKLLQFARLVENVLGNSAERLGKAPLLT